MENDKDARKQVMDYIDDYLADGFIDVGDISVVDKELLVDIEEALHGRRKVRVWVFDLIEKKPLILCPNKRGKFVELFKPRTKGRVF